MGDNYPAEDRSAALLERRWFAADRAAAESRIECAALAEVLQMAQSAWQAARARLERLETLRDTMGDELSAVNEQQIRRVSEAA
jgi:hypothetical protein